MTRQQYMSDSSKNFRKYYGQFVNEDVKATVLHYFTKEVLKESFQKTNILTMI